jgi:hypothetical protein
MTRKAKFDSDYRAFTEYKGVVAAELFEWQCHCGASLVS